MTNSLKSDLGMILPPPMPTVEGAAETPAAPLIPPTVPRDLTQYLGERTLNALRASAEIARNSRPPTPILPLSPTVRRHSLERATTVWKILRAMDTLRTNKLAGILCLRTCHLVLGRETGEDPHESLVARPELSNSAGRLLRLHLAHESGGGLPDIKYANGYPIPSEPYLPRGPEELVSFLNSQTRHVTVAS